MLTAYLLSATITPNKIIAAVVLLVVVVAGGAFYWMRSRKSAA